MDIENFEAAKKINLVNMVIRLHTEQLRNEIKNS